MTFRIEAENVVRTWIANTELSYLQKGFKFMEMLLLPWVTICTTKKLHVFTEHEIIFKLVFTRKKQDFHASKSK